MATQTVTSSKRFTLNGRDIIKAIYMSAILPALTIIYKSIEEGSMTFNWKLIGLTALGGFIGYLIKNLFSPAEIVITNPPKEDIEAVNKGEATAKVV